MSSARGQAAKSEKKRMLKRVALRMKIYETRWRLKSWSKPQQRDELQGKLDRLMTEYRALGGTDVPA